jgi:hypothetical protein
LQELRYDLVRSKQDRANHQHHQKRHAELAPEQQSQLDDWLLVIDLPRQEQQK